MNVNSFTPGWGSGPCLPDLVLAVAAAALAAHSQAWASALGTAVAVYTLLSTANRDNRS
ncbi:hypothetical protein ACFVZT_44595 [Streptomyces sp. NPDC058321]|uniref:hypothetical protein n=1 Tax=Streptomyces sp. NPDC058321 TaxID=3346445 RepID=UPI0036F18871